MKITTLLFNSFSLCIILSCSAPKKSVQKQIYINTHKDFDSTRNAEAREDSIQMAHSLMANAKFENNTWADVETDPVDAQIGEDAADDPAIWINKSDPVKSLILGTQKKSGLYAYDLKGKTKQFIPAGEINNVDLRDGFVYRGENVVLVAGSNRSINSISLFTIDNSTAILSDTIANIKSGVDEVYGICMYKSIISGKYYVIVNGKSGMIEQWEINSHYDSIEAILVRTFSVETQPEGMVANDKTGILYLGVEEQGICMISAEPDSNTELKWLNNSSAKNPAIIYDIEGLAIYDGGEKTYLIASIQGNFSYAIWDITRANKYLTSFTIWDLSIDGVEETDGLEVTSFPIGKLFPEGMLVVQDGFNYDGDTLVSQNFKYISWAKIQKFIE